MVPRETDWIHAFRLSLPTGPFERQVAGSLRRTTGLREAKLEHQKLFGGLMFNRDTVGEVQNGAQTTPVVGAERERGHAPGELPGK